MRHVESCTGCGDNNKGTTCEFCGKRFCMDADKAPTADINGYMGCAKCHVERSAKELLGTIYDAEIFTKAVKKAERYMRKAYGSIDWAELDAATLVAFYRETLKKPDGRDTFNRGT